tara:strand:- start:208 stop:537 length:330 start_codon:yes stop_codon:yes gene_type:complete
MSLPYDIKVFQACQRLDSKIVTCNGIESDDITNIITTDESGTEISLDKTVLEAEIEKIEAELDAVKYQDDRREEYPDIGTQLDYIYHNGIDKWKTDIVDPVKTKYPKPS